MKRHLFVLTGILLVSSGCARSANVEQERTALMAADRSWSESVKDLDKFVSFVASDATFVSARYAGREGPGGRSRDIQADVVRARIHAGVVRDEGRGRGGR